MDAAPASAVADMVEMLAGPNILHMVHSHAGAHVACRVLALGTAKQRKKVIKAMKGKLSCSHSHLSLPLLSQLGGYPCTAGTFLHDCWAQSALCCKVWVDPDLALHCARDFRICSRGPICGLCTAEAAIYCDRAREGDG